MDGSAVKEIDALALRAAAPVVVEEQTYTAVPMHDIRKPNPKPDPIKVTTLTGFVAYLLAIRDADKAKVVGLHVVGPGTVRALGALTGYFQQRFVFAEAVCDDRMSGTGFEFQKFFALESMNVALQALFEPTPDRERALRVIGNVRDEVVRGQVDDGVTQTVTAKSGIATVEHVQVPNPVLLRPRRTFAEVEQPESPFILRMKKTEGQGVAAALFEADGGAWRNAAMVGIADFLRAKVPGLPVLA